MADAHQNFAQSLVATAPSPATSGTSLVVTGGDGTKFPTAPFNAVIWPAGVQPTTANSEVIRVTAVSTDTFTIVRTQEGSSARTVVIGDQISANITAKTLTDAENPLTGVTGGTLPASTDILVIDVLEISATDSLEIPATSTLEITAYISQSDSDILNKILHDTFMGDVFDNQSAIARNVVLDANKDFMAPESFEIGVTGSLEIPATSSLEILTYLPVAQALNIASGWYPSVGTWVYQSANTFTAPMDDINNMTVGTKIRLTQTSIFYAYVASISGNLVTITTSSDYTLNNAAISAPYYSNALTAVGFPDYFNYTPTTVVGWSSTTQANSRFKMTARQVTVWVEYNGTSNSSATSFKVPTGLTAKSNGGFSFEGTIGLNTDNSVAKTTTGRVVIDPGTDTTVISAYLDQVTGAWTASGTKGTRFTIFYEV